MNWWRRCLVLVPVLSFLAAALMLSCGGGSSSSTTATILPTSLIAVAICTGSPPVPTPTPTPTTVPTHTPTPTPACSPTPTSAAICVPSSAFCGTTVNGVTVATTLQFNAQGTFTTHSTTRPDAFRDVTNHGTTAWNPFPTSTNFSGVINYLGNGEFVGVTAGCTCFNVTDAGFTSQTVLVGVNQDPATCPAPCP
jgi:hypothetical protein